MSCRHVNPPGYVFCGTCGEALIYARCRCGAVAGAVDVFCGRCGISMAETFSGGRNMVDSDHRFDLEQLMQQAAQEQQFLESSNKARVTQDDIRKLLTTRRRKF